MKSFKDLQNNLKQEDPDLFFALEFVGKIMAARDRKGISQRQLANLSGISQKTISRIENGLDIPKITTLLKLATHLDMEISLIDKKSQKNGSGYSHV